MIQEIVIDAKGKKLGRLASRAALALRGKASADFLPHRTKFPKIIVKNIDLLDLSEKKLKNIFFASYSGYPGGRKLKNAWEVAEKDKTIFVRRAILGMLPRNRLRKRMIKNLILKHAEDR